MDIIKPWIIKETIIERLPIYHNEHIIEINGKHLLLVLNLLKKHSNTRYDQLISVTATDLLQTHNSNTRFVINYQLLSVTFNKRLLIKVYTDTLTPIESIVHIYPSAGWYEREIWDLFGIFFLNNSDLRRILNDYGFDGYPFRKDFPLTGYSQIRYDDEKKRIISEPIELAQQIRIFNTI